MLISKASSPLPPGWANIWTWERGSFLQPTTSLCPYYSNSGGSWYSEGACKNCDLYWCVTNTDDDGEDDSDAGDDNCYIYHILLPTLCQEIY